MSPLFQKILVTKQARRKRLRALSYPEKVRIVEKMRAAAAEMKSAAWHPAVLREEPPAYGAKKP